MTEPRDDPATQHRPSVGGMCPPGLLADLRTGPAAAARRWVDVVGAGVFALSIDAAWCADFLARYDARLTALERDGVRPNPPNSMHHGGAALRDLGWDDLFDDALGAWLQPLAAPLFPECGGPTLDSIYAFVADYGHGADEELGFHVDNAEVTFNLCLGGDFEGSELYFRGRRCVRHRQDDWRADEEIDWHHRPGTAVLHAGADRHGVEFLESGRRRNLILWLQSSAYRAEQEALGTPCPQWCGAAPASGHGGHGRS